MLKKKKHKDQQNKNGKKNNCMDISRDQQVKSHAIRLGHG